MVSFSQLYLSAGTSCGQKYLVYPCIILVGTWFFFICWQLSNLIYYEICTRLEFGTILLVYCILVVMYTYVWLNIILNGYNAFIGIITGNSGNLFQTRTVYLKLMV